jgi:hypothetical protein
MNCSPKKIAHSSNKEIAMATAKKPAPRKIPTTRPKGTPAPVPAKPAIKKAPAKMTPQDAAMKKILEGKYGRIYG